MEKDHTYSTQAELAKDEQELQGLMQRIQGQQARSEEQLAKLEGEMLTETTSELKLHLEMYNKEAGFDVHLQRKRWAGLGRQWLLGHHQRTGERPMPSTAPRKVP